LPHELLARVDDLTDNRNDFIREAVSEKLVRTKQNGKSAWEALSRTAGLEVTIPKAPEKVKPRSELPRF
jgi:metal-responsive CopG/Arc/MetJ family transcriptional regulator